MLCTKRIKFVKKKYAFVPYPGFSITLILNVVVVVVFFFEESISHLDNASLKKKEYCGERTGKELIIVKLSDIFVNL